MEFDLGVSIDPVAPQPHLVAAGSRAVLIFRSGAVGPLGWVVFEGVAAVSLGGSNSDERPEDRGLGRRVAIDVGSDRFECVCSGWQSGSVDVDLTTALALAARALRSGPEVFESHGAGKPSPRQLPFVELYRDRNRFDEALGDASRSGWQVVRFDAGSWVSPDDMHTALAAALSFPGYYGRNLDALDDCIRDVVNGDYGFDPDAPGGLIALEGFDRFAAREPRVARGLIEILGGASVEALRRGWQLATFVQSDDPAIHIGPVGGQAAAWNRAEQGDAGRR